MNKKKILIIAAVVLFGGGYIAKGMLLPPKAVKTKIAGTLYVMPGQFLVNLSGGQYGKVNVALELAPGQSDGASATATASPDSTYGTLPEEAVVRTIVTNALSGQPGSRLVGSTGRAGLEHTILKQINTTTDVKVTDVMFTDVAVQ